MKKEILTKKYFTQKRKRKRARICEKEEAPEILIFGVKSGTLTKDC